MHPFLCVHVCQKVSTFKICDPLSVDGQSGPAEKEIFLSYGHTEDVNPFVLKLQKDLEARGFSVWLDKTDIPPGHNWRRAIGVQVE